MPIGRLPQLPPKHRQLPFFPPQRYVETIITPQDSDTDSGISADCDQSSPRGLQNGYNPHCVGYASIQKYRPQQDYLTPNSARKIATQSTPRRLPAQPQVVPQQVTKTKNFRVRFADEVDSGASTSSGISSAHASPRTDSTPPSTTPTKFTNAFENSPVNNNKKQQQQQQQQLQQQQQHQRLRNEENLIAKQFNMMSFEQQPTATTTPPPYTVAMQQRARPEPPRESFRDAMIRKNVTDTLQRRFRQRSSSLPRGGAKSYFESIEDMPRSQEKELQFGLTNLNTQLPGSLDNLNITMGSMKRRKLPPPPIMGSSVLQFLDPTVKPRTPQPPYHSPMASRRFPTATRSPEVRFQQTQQNYEQQDFGSYGVRAQLIALDQRGFRRVLVEKMMPGPFGFYIATGMFSGHRGIFISRISLPSLFPMLTVGDEIIYVDDELVKGQTLEYVQSVIAGKTSVMITLLPAVGQSNM